MGTLIWNVPPIDERVKATLKRYVTDDNIQLVNELLKDVQWKPKLISVASSISKFSSKSNAVPWQKPPNVPTRLPDIVHKEVLATHNSEIIDALENNEVVIVSAGTGLGKSVLAPYWTVEAMRRMSVKNPSLCSTGLRIFHSSPHGEQVIQSTEYVKEGYRIACNLNMAHHTSSFNRAGKECPSTLSPSETHYVTATPFFAKFAFEEGSKVQAAVVDECHLVDPDLERTMRGILERLKDTSPESLHRVLLLSATTSDKIIKDMENFFTGFRVAVINVTGSKFTRTIIEAGDDFHSKIAFQRADKVGTCTEDAIRQREVLKGGKPNAEVLNNRVVSFMEELCSGRSLDGRKNPGCLAFCPGVADVMMTKGRFGKIINNAKSSRNFVHPLAHSIRTSIVSGSNRSDCSILENYHQRGTIRSVFSTPLLATGCTLLGVDTIIDSGLQKFPGPYDRRGLRMLELHWQDYCSKEQRAGRVARTDPGFVYQAFSRERSSQMTSQDHTYTIYDRALVNTDIVSEMVHRSKTFVSGSNRTLLELTSECGVLGFIHSNLWTEEGPTNVHKFGVLNPIAGALSKVLHSTPLQYGHLLLRSMINRVSLSGFLLAASIATDHNCFRRPSRRPGAPGRDDPEQPYNYYADQCGRDTEMMNLVEMMLLALLHILPDEAIDEEWKNNIKVPDEFLKMINRDAVEQAFNHIQSYINGLKSLGLGVNNVKCLLPESGFELVDLHNGWKIYRMNKQKRDLFHAAIIIALGHRSGISLHDRRVQHPLYQINVKDKDAKGFEGIVQSERKEETSSTRHIGIYDEIFQRDPDDPKSRLVALIHNVTPFQFLLFGNDYGSNADTSFGSGCLIVMTNSHHYQFVFDKSDWDSDVVTLIKNFRKMIKAALDARFTGDAKYKTFTRQTREVITALYELPDACLPCCTFGGTRKVDKLNDNAFDFIPDIDGIYKEWECKLSEKEEDRDLLENLKSHMQEKLSVSSSASPHYAPSE